MIRKIYTVYTARNGAIINVNDESYQYLEYGNLYKIKNDNKYYELIHIFYNENTTRFFFKSKGSPWSFDKSVTAEQIDYRTTRTITYEQFKQLAIIKKQKHDT